MRLELFKNKLARELGDLQRAVYPKRRIFEQMREDLQGMTSENVMTLLSVAARSMSKEQTYLEVGCYRGCTACAAMSRIRGKRFVFIDDFSQFDKRGLNKQILLKNLNNHRHSNRYRFFEGSFDRIFRNKKLRYKIGTVGVYFYDGAHDYDSQVQGLLAPYDLLAKGALVIVDDVNMQTAREADDKLIRSGHFKLVYRFRTSRANFKRGWWNGIDILVKP